jgi:hypothetical protein
VLGVNTETSNDCVRKLRAALDLLTPSTDADKPGAAKEGGPSIRQLEKEKEKQTKNKKRRLSRTKRTRHLRSTKINKRARSDS